MRKIILVDVSDAQLVITSQRGITAASPNIVAVEGYIGIKIIQVIIVHSAPVYILLIDGFPDKWMLVRTQERTMDHGLEHGAIDEGTRFACGVFGKEGAYARSAFLAVEAGHDGSRKGDAVFSIEEVMWCVFKEGSIQANEVTWLIDLDEIDWMTIVAWDIIFIHMRSLFFLRSAKWHIADL